MPKLGEHGSESRSPKTRLQPTASVSFCVTSPVSLKCLREFPASPSAALLNVNTVPKLTSAQLSSEAPKNPPQEMRDKQKIE